MKNSYYSRQTILGKITILEEHGCVNALYIGECPDEKLCGYKFYLSVTLKNAFNQLDEYFAGKRKEFNLRFNLIGTEFQLRVWNELMKIPYGRTVCYGDLAKKIGSPEACRAVGMACHANRIPIFIPCHRVISSDGSLGGYAHCLENKLKLLEIEGFTNF